MKKAWKRLLTWGLCLSLLLSYGALAADMMPMDGMGPPRAEIWAAHHHRATVHRRQRPL